jgi:hypothetical protein
VEAEATVAHAATATTTAANLTKDCHPERSEGSALDNSNVVILSVAKDLLLSLSLPLLFRLSFPQGIRF